MRFKYSKEKKCFFDENKYLFLVEKKKVKIFQIFNFSKITKTNAKKIKIFEGFYFQIN